MRGCVNKRQLRIRLRKVQRKLRIRLRKLQRMLLRKWILDEAIGRWSQVLEATAEEESPQFYRH